MSRSGYTEDCDDQWSLIRWRGAVASALRGKRGQAFLRETLAALDALPTQELITNEFVEAGAVCTLGAVGRQRGLDLTPLDPDDHVAVAATFAIPHALACEVMYENDEGDYWGKETPRQRWERMRRWVAAQIKEDQRS